MTSIKRKYESPISILGIEGKDAVTVLLLAIINGTIRSTNYESVIVGYVFALIVSKIKHRIFWSKLAVVFGPPILIPLAFYHLYADVIAPTTDSNSNISKNEPQPSYSLIPIKQRNQIYDPGLSELMQDYWDNEPQVRGKWLPLFILKGRLRLNIVYLFIVALWDAYNPFNHPDS